MQNDHQNQEYMYDEIDLKDIFKTLAKWKYTIAGVTIAAMLISGIISFYFIDPVYEADTVVSVSTSEKKKEVTTDIEEMVDELGELPYMNVQTCLQQVESPGILQTVIAEMELPYSRRQLAGIIGTEQIKDTNLIKITVSGSDPQLAAQIANKVRENFVLHINTLNNLKMEQSLDIMENDLLQKEEADLKQANDNLKEYKLQSRSIEFLTTQLEQKNLGLAELQTALALAEIDRDKLEKEVIKLEESLQNTPVTIPTSTTADGILPADMAGIDIKDGRVTSENINEAYTSLMSICNEKKAELEGLKAAVNTTRSEIQRLQNEIPDLEAELTRNQIEETKLQNEVDRRENTINVLTAKIADVKMTGSVNLAEHNITTVSAAMTPENPVKPNKKLNIAIAAILGLMLSTLTVFLLEYLREDENESQQTVAKS